MKSLVETLRTAGYFSSLDVHFADTMCRLAGENDSLVRLGAATASRYTTSGHVLAPLGELSGEPVATPTETLIDKWPGEDDWLCALKASSLVGSGEPPTPLVLEGKNLYLFRYWNYETNLAANLARRAKITVPGIDEHSLGASLNKHSKEAAGLGDFEQVVRIAATSGLTLISGGPGTGKTSIVVAILATLIEQADLTKSTPPRVALLAPTGKAAARLSESILSVRDKDGPYSRYFARGVFDRVPYEASTIHRALGTRKKTPTSFVHGKDNPLPADVVIVDEASMVDIALMAKLEEAVSEHARLILIGDKNQLASVEAGAVLSEINIPSKAIGLTENYRFSESSDIYELAEGINVGRALPVIQNLEEGNFDKVCLVDPKVMTEKSLTAFLRPYVESKYAPQFRHEDPLKKLKSFESFRILTAHREGLMGAAGINNVIENILRAGGLVPGNAQWYDGRPVMVTQNDYQLGVFNGDVAIAAKGSYEHELKVHFLSSPGKVTGISPSRLQKTETAYAMTVHKAQGSEFEEVLVVLPSQWSPIVTRQLLYTAVTRARKRVTLVASKEVLIKAIETPTKRAIALGNRIQKLL